VPPDIEAVVPDRHAEALRIDLEPGHRGAQHVIAQAFQHFPGVGGGVRPGNAAVQQDGRARRLVPDRAHVADLLADRRGPVDLDRRRPARNQDLVRVPHRRPGDAGVVLQLRRVDDDHIVRPGDLRHTPMQFAGWQRDDPEWKRRLGQRETRIHGRQI
jgi:hypothetical protein